MLASLSLQATHFPNQVENFYLELQHAPPGEYVVRVSLFSADMFEGAVPWSCVLTDPRGGAQSRTFCGELADIGAYAEAVRFEI